MDRLVIIQFAKFCLIGFTGLFIDFSLTFFCKEMMKLNPYLSGGFGFSIAALLNYYANAIFNFKVFNPNEISRIFSFIIVSIVGLLFNVIITYLLDRFLFIPFFVGKLLATIVVVLWNFLANKLFTFTGLKNEKKYHKRIFFLRRKN